MAAAAAAEDSAADGGYRFPASAPIPRYRYPSPAAAARPVSIYSNEAGGGGGGGGGDGGGGGGADTAVEPPRGPHGPAPPRLLTVSVRSSNDYGAKATYGDVLTVYAESDVPLRSAPVLQIDGVCAPRNMTVCADRLNGGPVASGGVSVNGSAPLGGTAAVADWTRFTTQVQLQQRPPESTAAAGSSSSAIPDGPLNLTFSGYASAADGAPGPPVSGMSHGAMVIFDATPPRVLRALPAAVTAANDDNDTSDAADDAAGAATVRAGDFVTVMLEASKPVRSPNVTINDRPAWITRTSWDGTSYHASREIVEDDESGAISFYVQPLVDFAGNVDKAGGTSDFTHGVPPRVEHS